MSHTSHSSLTFCFNQADLEDRQRRLVRFENVQELMQQYKKPLLASAFDLQSRLANQVGMETHLAPMPLNCHHLLVTKAHDLPMAED
jgi:hypothetical protein